MTFTIKTLNAISHTGLSRLPKEEFEVSSDIENPDAIMLRSANLHGVGIPASVLAVARAGAGTNNIPIPDYSARGIPVFSAFIPTVESVVASRCSTPRARTRTP